MPFADRGPGVGHDRVTSIVDQRVRERPRRTSTVVFRFSVCKAQDGL